MARQAPRSIVDSPRQTRAKSALAMATAEVRHDQSSVNAAVVPKTRQIHRVGEVNISAYFPAEVKASLRMVQAKTGYNVKDCLAEALRDLFRKHNVPASAELGEGR